MRRANDPQRREKIIQATLEAVKLTEYMLLHTAKLLPLPGCRWDR